ncbi:MAG: hypothetical protein WBN89_11165 [Prochlorococcaceae cyanobacterium]
MAGRARNPRLPVLVLLGAAVLSTGLMGAHPAEGLQLPLAAVLAALLPLQLAALFYAVRRRQDWPGLRAAERPAPDLRPPASG